MFEYQTQISEALMPRVSLVDCFLLSSFCPSLICGPAAALWPLPLDSGSWGKQGWEKWGLHLFRERACCQTCAACIVMTGPVDLTGLRILSWGCRTTESCVVPRAVQSVHQGQIRGWNNACLQWTDAAWSPGTEACGGQRTVQGWWDCGGNGCGRNQSESGSFQHQVKLAVG